MGELYIIHSHNREGEKEIGDNSLGVIVLEDNKKSY